MNQAGWMWYSIVDIFKRLNKIDASWNRHDFNGEVGLTVAGVGVTSGALCADIYTAIIIMVAATTVLSPIWLRKSYTHD